MTDGNLVDVFHALLGKVNMSKSIVWTMRSMIAFAISCGLLVVAYSEIAQKGESSTDSQLVVSRPYSLDDLMPIPVQQSQMQLRPAIGLLEEESAI